MANLNFSSIATLTGKLWDSDPDIRYMSLNDLATAFGSSHADGLRTDYQQCAKLVEGFLKTLNDPNGEVQNLTIRCLAGFVLKCHAEMLGPLLLEIAQLPHESSLDRTTSAMATRAIVVALPRPGSAAARPQPVQHAYAAVSRVLIPWLVGRHVLGSTSTAKAVPLPAKGILAHDLETGQDSGYIDVLTEVASCFGPVLQPAEVEALEQITVQLLESPRTSSVVRKRAVVALSALSHFFSDALLSAVTSHIMTVMTDPHLTHGLRRLYLSVLASIARAIPSKFGPHLKTLAPFALSAVSQQELDEQMQQLAGADDDDDNDGDNDDDLDDDGAARDAALNEVREAAFVALESFLVSCPDSMQAYHDDTLDAALRFIKYDPNVTAFDDDNNDNNDDDTFDDANSNQDDDDDAYDLDQDFEEEGGLDDDDDVSWKVRRCAAKTLNAYISIRQRDLADTSPEFDRIAHALVDRFVEREESVRIEILQTLGSLIRSTTDQELQPAVAVVTTAPTTAAAAAAASNATATITPTSTVILDQSLPAPSLKRKRQRRSSDVSMLEAVKQRRLTGSTSPEALSPSTSGAAASSLKLVADKFIRGIVKLLKTGPLPTKQAALALLQDFVVARQGGLADSLAELVALVVKMLDSAGADSLAAAGAASLGLTPGAGGNASATTLQIEALRVLGDVAKTHSSSDVQPLLPGVIAAVVATARNRSHRVALEALKTTEQLVKLITPPRSAAASKDSAAQLEQLRDAVAAIVTSKYADTQVRSEAIHVLAVLLGRTLSPEGSRLLSAAARSAALELLYESSRNETTRFATIKALEALALLAPADADHDAAWLGRVCLELGAQLRKANRSLRGASLQTLRTLLAGPRAVACLTPAAGEELVATLVPLLVGRDLHMVGPTLLILASLVAHASFAVATDDLVRSFAELVADPIAVNVVDQLVDVVTAIGAAGHGKPLMTLLLRDAGVTGSPAVVGKLIGDLAVSGGDSVGISVDAFHKELETSTDDRRRCLALSVLGEVGLRSGASSAAGATLSPDLFIRYFGTQSPDVPLAAAVALGRAATGKGNGKTYVPAILALADSGRASPYLVMHAVREILNYSEHTDELEPFHAALWAAAVQAARADDTRTVGADCIANLAILHPRRYLHALQQLVADAEPSVRGAAILAFRDVFGGTDASFDRDLRPVVVEMLSAMLRDAELENRRSALNTFNAATRNKAGLVMPHLSELLPLVLAQTVEDASLVREVKMGPFVHRVDDGLECRKSAYETLYTTVEIAPAPHLAPQLPALYDRVVVGLGDDHSIRALCSIMVGKFAVSTPLDTQRRLDVLADRFRTILSVTLKDTAVRHEHERVDEAKRGAVRSALELARLLPGGLVPVSSSGGPGVSSQQQQQQPQTRWLAFLDEMRATQRKLVDEVERDAREKERS